MQYSNVYVAENLLNDVNRMSTLTAVLLNNKQSNEHVQTVIHCSIQAFFSKKQCCSSEGEGGFVFQTIHKQNYKFSWRDILILWGECPPPPLHSLNSSLLLLFLWCFSLYILDRKTWKTIRGLHGLKFSGLAQKIAILAWPNVKIKSLPSPIQPIYIFPIHSMAHTKFREKRPAQPV